MRKVPELRFDGFDGEWEETKIGALSKVVRGASPRPISDQKWFDGNSDVGWLRISDVTTQNGRIHELEQKLSIDGQKKTRVYRTPHLILSIAASVGKPVINYINTGVHDGFIIFEEPKFDLEYMFQRLDSIQLSWSKYGQPGSQVNLNSDIVKNRRINLPNLKEQEKIGDLFKKLDDLIEIQETKISKMEDFKKSMLQKMFPKKGELVPEFRFYGFDGEWEKKKISDIGKISAGGDVDKKKISNKGRYPVIANGDSNNGIIGYYEDHYKISEPAVTISARGNIGTAVARNYPFTPVIRVLTLTSDNNIYFMSEAINRLRIFNESSGVPQLTSPQFGGYNIYMTKLSEQQKIGNFFKNLDSQIENEEKLLDSYKMMKKSLLQKMFV